MAFPPTVTRGFSPRATLEVSTNLVDWVGVARVMGTNDSTGFVDEKAGNFGWRFGRVAGP